ncbi:MAG: flagellar basal body L-ring protein FlgH [Pseudomonadota bacterium]
MKTLMSALVLLALLGCSATPSSIVQKPTSARPLYTEPPVAQNGAIYQAAHYRPLFEDRRARHIGDMLTIAIVEKTSADKTGASSGNKNGTASFGLPGAKAIRKVFGNTVSTDASTEFSDGDKQSASNTFTGTITVTVTEVLSNGNLIVAGEKQVALNKGVEFVRFSGMVSPDNIGAGNTVASSSVADARVEYRTNSQIDRAEMTAMVSRFFQSLIPF